MEAEDVAGLIANQFIAIPTDNAVIFWRESTVRRPERPASKTAVALSFRLVYGLKNDWSFAAADALLERRL